jgi:hypothetical protein
MEVTRQISWMLEGAFLVIVPCGRRMVDVDPNFRGATADTVKKAFEILLCDPKVKSIFINIFGGMCHAVVHSTRVPNTPQVSCDAILSLRA